MRIKHLLIVVFALVIVYIVMNLPAPGTEEEARQSGETTGYAVGQFIGNMLTSPIFWLAFLGLMIWLGWQVVAYWRSNRR